MRHIGLAASKEIIDAYNVIPTGQESVAKVRAEKAGTASD